MKRLIGLSAIALLAAACGDVASDVDPGPDAGPIDEEDTTPPEIVSIIPADGAIGVRADAVVTIAFSEPMDRLSVQNSLDTSDLGGVTFTWSDGNATLTIEPNDPLAYAEGTGNVPADTTANQFAVILGTGAADEAGNTVESGTQVTFSTLKQMTSTFGRDNALTGAGTPGGVTTDADDFVYVGDDAMGAAAAGYRGYVTMDLTLLPDTAEDIVWARLRGNQLAEIGNPYGALGATTGVILEHTVFTLGTQLEANAAFNQSPLSEVGVFANAGETTLTIEVSEQVRDDLANRATRNSRSQYRLRFSEFTNLDNVADYVLIGRDELELELVYLAP